jgi:hypothetical protein
LIDLWRVVRRRRNSFADLLVMNPINGSDCCARAASGHPAATLPKNVMKSRRLKDRPFIGELTIGGCLVQHSNPEPLMSALGLGRVKTFCRKRSELGEAVTQAIFPTLTMPLSRPSAAECP